MLLKDESRVTLSAPDAVSRRACQGYRVGMIALALLLAAAPTDVERLAAGEILVKKPGKDAVQVVAVIDAPPDKVWPIVSDCARYKTTMPSIADSQMLSRDGDTMTCRVTADIPFPFPDLVSVTRAKHTVTPDRYERKWTMIEGDYEKNEGSWLLEPFGPTGTQTLATYSLLARPKIPLPDAMVQRVQESRLPDMMKSLRKQVVAK